MEQEAINFPYAHDSHGFIGTEIDKLKVFRTTGIVIISNPVTFIIPCHRVIKSTGDIGVYM